MNTCKNTPEQVLLIITLSVIFSEKKKSSTPNTEQFDRCKRHVNWSGHGVWKLQVLYPLPPFQISLTAHSPALARLDFLPHSFTFFTASHFSHSVGENVGNCLNSSRVDIRSYGKTPVHRTGLLGSAVARRVVTMVTWCQLRLTCWYQTSAGRVIYERQAGNWWFWQGCLCGSNLKRGFCQLVLVRGKVTLDCEKSGLMKAKKEREKKGERTKVNCRD